MSGALMSKMGGKMLWREQRYYSVFKEQYKEALVIDGGEFIAEASKTVKAIKEHGASTNKI